MWILNAPLSLFANILFPAECLFCKRKQEVLCSFCIAAFRKSIEEPYPWIHTTFLYRDEQVKKTIKLIKYYHRKDLVKPLVRASITDDLHEFLRETSNCVLVPVPSPTRRVLLRGYNQAKLIASSYSELLHIPLDTSILVRKKYTKQQAKVKHGKERLNNIQGAFAAHGKDLNKKIILVDDTTTTGTTLLHAKNVLERYGYKDVLAITLAH